jgi:acetylornithine deacetylase
LPRKQDLKNQVLEWIDSNEDNIVGYLQDLIRIPSVNPWFFTEPEASKEQDVQRYLARHLKSLGGEVSLWEADADQLTEYEGRAGYYAGRDFTGRPNLAAVFPGSGGG